MMDFKTEKNGYSREQIDSYINIFANKYREMQKDYTALLEKKKELAASLQETKDNAERQRSAYEARIKDLESQIADLKLRPEPSKSNGNAYSNADVIAKVLIDAEVLAKQTVEKARMEANRITSAAKAELEKTTNARDQVFDELEHIQAILDSFKK